MPSFSIEGEEWDLKLIACVNQTLLLSQGKFGFQSDRLLFCSYKDMALKMSSRCYVNFSIAGLKKQTSDCVHIFG